MRFLPAASLLLVTLACVIPAPADARPSTAWRTRNTGLDSEGQCTRRAFRAVKAANMEGKASGELAVFGGDEGSTVYVVCTNGGRLAVVFCASDRANSGVAIGQTCDTVSRFMER